MTLVEPSNIYFARKNQTAIEQSVSFCSRKTVSVQAEINQSPGCEHISQQTPVYCDKYLDDL